MTIEKTTPRATAQAVGIQVNSALERRNIDLLSHFVFDEPEEKAAKPKRGRNSKAAPVSQEYTINSDMPLPIRPRYPLSALELVIDECPELARTIRGHVIATGGQGFKLVPTVDRQKLDPVRDALTLKEIDSERDQLDAFIRYICPTRSATDVFGLVFEGRRKYGFGAWEILRNAADQVVGVNPIEDIKTLRPCAYDEQVIEYDRQIRIGNTVYTQSEPRRFRRFVQEIIPRRFSVTVARKKIYFKEFGDPRFISRETGEIFQVGEPLPDGFKPATEILWFPIVSTGEEMPLPEWLPGLPDALASRAIRICNLDVLDNGGTPPLAIIIEGAENPQLAVEIRDQLKQLKGQSSRSKAVIIQTGAQVAGSGVNKEVVNPKIRIEDLSKVMATEGMFIKYLEWLDKSITSLFRLPQILVGKVDSTLNRATAEQAISIAEQTVLQPERQAVEDLINNVFLPEVCLYSRRATDDRGIKYWKFAFNNFSIDRTEAAVKILTAGKDDLTLNERREILDSVLPGEYEAFKQEAANIPPALRGLPIEPMPDNSAITQDMKDRIAASLGKSVDFIGVLDLER
jgi:capsid portal protein